MKNILLAIRRNRKLFAISIIFGITTLWAIYEPFVSICFPDAFSNPNNKYWFLLIFLLPSFIIALIRIYPQKSISIELKNTNSFVNIKFGDLFEQDGLKAISVNEYFDSEIGKPVSDNFFIKLIIFESKISTFIR